MGGNPITLEARIPIRFVDFIDEDSIAKQTKTYALVNVDVESAKDLQSELKAIVAKGGKGPAKKQAERVLPHLKEVVKAVKSLTSDVAALELEQHPIGAILPAMSKSDLKELRKSMESHGYLSGEAIDLYEGKVLDGWHRYNAARSAGVTPEFTNYRGDDPVGHVMAKNLQRRHLSDDQRSMVAAELYALDESEDIEDAAATVNVPASKAKRAQRIANHHPKLKEAVQSGEIKLTDAFKIVQDPEMVDKLHEGYKGDMTALIPEDKPVALRRKAEFIKLETVGVDAWQHAETVYDDEGNELGEAYWRPALTPLDELDVDDMIERVEDAIKQPAQRLDKRYVREAALEVLEDREIDALYLGFKGDEPEDMTRAKINRLVVSELVTHFEAIAEDELGEEEDLMTSPD